MILMRLAPLLIAAWASPALGQVNLEYQYGGSGPGAAGSYGPNLSHAFGGTPSGAIGGSGSAALLGSWQAQLAQEQQHAQALAERWARLGQTQREESPQAFLEKYNQKQRAAAAKAAPTWHDPAFQTSIMEWPWIKSNPTDWNRLDYAESVARWAEKIQPIESFNPPKGLNETQAELKLFDALAALRDVKDTEGSKMADEQKEEMDSPVTTVIKDTAKDKAIEWAIHKLISEAAEKAFSRYGDVKSALKPVVFADDAILTRNVLQRQIESQLDAYQRKRDLANDVLPLSQPSYVQILIESGWGTNQYRPTMNRLD